MKAQAAWQLMWSDEFNGPVNQMPDASKWAYDLGNNNGWGNGELENYTNLPENAHLDGNGNLDIHVESGPNGFTSARLKTLGLFAVQYGRIEARIRLPAGQGIWPAFWMLGSDYPVTGWPQSGEIDVMENIGSEPGTNHGSLHGPGYSGGNAVTASYTLPDSRSFADDFHTFAIEWSPGSIKFFVDATLYRTVTPSSLPGGTPWVFDKSFFLLLNVAVGGTFPGPPDAATIFPQDMLVDYVRVYQLETTAGAPEIFAGGVVDSASFGPSLSPGALASIFGKDLSGSTGVNLFDPALQAFPPLFAGTRVLVNGVAAPLTYVSPSQINFQIPWETLTGLAVNVEVEQGGTLSNPGGLTLSSASPSTFGIGGVAILTCVEGPPAAGVHCTLWTNGLGPAQPGGLDGVPAPIGSLEYNSCLLTIAGVPATVTFCGAAPSLIISQLNFVYPQDVDAGSSLKAEITSNGKTGEAVLH